MARTARAVTVIPSTINPLTRMAVTSVAKRRVAGYARVSTDSDEQFTSYEAQIGIVNKCAVEKYPKSQAAIPPVPPVRIFAGGSPCGLKLFTRMVL